MSVNIEVVDKAMRNFKQYIPLSKHKCTHKQSHFPPQSHFLRGHANRQFDRQADIQAVGKAGGQAGGWKMGRQVGEQVGEQVDRPAGRQVGRKVGSQADSRWLGRQKGMQTGRALHNQLRAGFRSQFPKKILITKVELYQKSIINLRTSSLDLQTLF